MDTDVILVHSLNSCVIAHIYIMIYLSILLFHEHSDGFQFFNIISNATATNFFLNVSLCIYARFYSRVFLEVELLVHEVWHISTLLDTINLLYKVILPIYTLTSNVYMFLSLHFLLNPWCCQSYVVNGISLQIPQNVGSLRIIILFSSLLFPKS